MISLSLTVVFLPVLLWLLISWFLYTQASNMVFSNDISYGKLPRTEYMQEFIDWKDGKRLDAVWFENSRSQEVILALHGNAGRTIPMFDTLPLRYNVLSVAYPGYHYSDGEVSMQGSYEAAKKAYDYLVNEKGFAEDKIIIYGHSLGGSVAINLASKKPEAQKLIIVNTFHSIKSMCKRSYGIFCIFSDGIFNSVKDANKVKIPVRHYHLKNDDTIPFEEGEKLFEEFTETDDKEFFELDFGAHTFYDYNKTLNS